MNTKGQQIFLHIGLPKSASTFLQKKVFNLFPIEDVSFHTYPSYLINPIVEFMRHVYVNKAYSDQSLLKLKKKLRII